METGYSPFKIASFFIEKAHRSGEKITPMKLIKLVYISHAWSLALLKKPLISESVQAWKYGPVIESLYHSYKRYGNGQIPSTEADSISHGDLDDQTITLLEKVWEKYGKLGGTHLSALTHQKDTPWDQIWNQKGGNGCRYVLIPDDLIRDFYNRKIESPSGSGH